MTVYQPEEWNSSITPRDSIAVDGREFGYQGAARDYAISVPRPGAIRFELRDGDQHFWDVEHNNPAERVEIAQRQSIDNGTPLQVSYQFMLEPGQPNTAWGFTMGQLHQSHRPNQPPLAPPFGIGMMGERMGMSIRYTDSTGKPVEKVVFADGYDIVRGHNYDIDIKAVFDPAGNGRLVVTRDGVTIVDYAGPLGYAEDTGVYWAEGLYRHSNATETVAAVYGNLDITTGNSIVFPNPDDFIGAPTRSVPQAHYDSASATSSVTVAGTAEAGMTVVLSENGKILGSVTTDSSGHYSKSLTFSKAGEYHVRAVVIDAKGREGVAANPLTVKIGTADEIAPRLNQMMADKNLGTIVLTDHQPLTIDSHNYIKQYIASGLVDKIEGDLTFKVVKAGNGISYDKQIYFYNAQGTLVEYERLSGSRLVLDQTFHADGSSTTQSWAADGSHDVNVTNGSIWIEHSKYNSANYLTLHKSFFSDGTQKTVTYFNQVGVKTVEINFHQDGTRSEATYGIVGKTYDTQVIYYNAANAKTEYQRLQGDKLIFDESYAADGTVTTQIWGKDSSHDVNVLRNGVWVEQSKYDAADHLTFHKTFFPNGSQQAVTSFNPATGAKTAETLYQQDGSRAEATYGIVGKTYDTQVTHYNAAGVKTEYQRLQGDKLLFDESYGTDGTVTTHMWAANGSHDVNVTRAGLWVEQSKYDAADHLTFHKAFFPDGTQQAVTYFDPATGAKTKETVYQHDGSRAEAVYGIVGKPYDAQVVHFNAAGVKTDYERLQGGKVVFDESYNTDGTIKTQETFQYDSAGRTTLHATNYYPGGSGDHITYTYSGTSTSPVASELKHYADGGRLQWKDSANADGTHTQTVTSAGAVLSSHEGVADRMVGLDTASDTFIFAKNMGADVVTNFHTHADATPDQIGLDSHLVNNFDALLANFMTAQGADTLITFDDHNSVLLKDVALSSLTSHDFFFV